MNKQNIADKLKSKKYDLIILLLLFFFGFVLSFSYGAYLDQSSEQKILFSNIKEYMQCFPLDSQMVQEMESVGIVEISQSIEKDHGIATYYPIFFVWYINQISPYYGSIIWHMYTYLFIYVIGGCSLYFFVSDIFNSRKIATLVLTMFFFTPRVFSDCHYNNKDMILLALLFACIYCGWRTIKECSWINIVLLAISGAFIFNAKIIGLCLFGLIGLYILLYYIFKRKIKKSVIIKAIVCIVLWFAVYILITPASWNDLARFLQYLFKYAVDFERWRGYILYNGKMIHTEYTGIPHKYLPTMMILTIPVGILLLILCGYFFLAYDIIKSKFRCLFSEKGYIAIVALEGIIPLGYAVLAQTTVYNGWRHFYFVYATMIIIGGYGIYSICSRIKKERVKKVLKYGAIIYISILLGGILVNHPQEHSYYNMLAGNSVEQDYELDYWNLSVYQAYKIIYNNNDTKDKITVGTLNIPTMWGLDENYTVLPDTIKKRVEVVERWEEAEYLIVNTTYAYMYSKDDYDFVKEHYILVDTIESYGNAICEVYRKS